VPDGVVDQIGHQAFGQTRIARRRGGGERGAEADAAALGLGLAGQQDVPGDVGQVQGLRAPEPALAVGQREQGRDQALLLIAELHQLLAGGAQPLDGRFRVGDRDLEQGAAGRERGPQLVGRIGDEVALRIK